MNLLTNGASPEGAGSDNEVTDVQEAGATPSDPSGKKEDATAQTVSPARVTVVDEGKNDLVSQEILNRLSEELQEDLQQTASGATAPAQQSSSDAASESQAATVASSPESGIASDTQNSPDDSVQLSADAASVQNTEEDIIMQSEPNISDLSDVTEPDNQERTTEAADAPVEETVEAAAGSAPQKPSDNPPKKGEKKGIHHSILPRGQVGNPLLDGEYRFVNVMEQLILRQDIDDFLRQYNVCTCERCVADVCALTLSGLPAKYVVSSKDSLSPLLSYYESKYKIYMLTEIIKACNKVRENPRHKK